jgi:ABC-type transport system involved in cytochrome bd biosynthesis fused ATPase/permease subunit
VPDALRLRTGAVTVVLGTPARRRQLLAALDEDDVRCSSAHAAPGRRIDLTAAGRAAEERAAALQQRSGASVVLVDRPTAGLDAAGRRTVLDALRRLAGTGTAVLVDDDDVLPVLGVADAALRVDADGGLRDDDLSVAG